MDSDFHFPPASGGPEDLVSVILTVYNVDKWLKKTLESILGQTWKDLELIAVDDGSGDGSPQILREAAKRDPRVRVVRTENRGVSCARNLGLSLARGKYVYFCDSDDVMDPRLLEECVGAMKKFRAQIAMFKFDGINEFGAPVPSFYPHNRYRGLQVLDRREIIKKQIRGKIGGYLWAFAAERKMYEGVKFPEGRLVEDTARICQIFANARRIVRIPRVLYHYRLHKSSLMRKEKMLMDWKKALKDRLEFVSETFPDLKGWARVQTFSPLNFDYESVRQNLAIGLRSRRERKRLSRRPK
ncbi:MAG: glycosyltransferase family 2 protein [Aeriscardovia sp.]|nr:glycosyltransferase family 2 protein [Aeriscardovia sp.]